ncbi:MAG: GNAT family N-acetyltransferase [Eubacteriaceae bacterium]|nr:GNAT family N-acetyltransferase [Eubacteriaceae bacterium]
MKRYELETERLILTTGVMAMAEAMLDLEIRNKAHFEPWEDIRPKDFYTLNYQRQLIRDEKKNREAGSGIDYWIFLKSTGKLIGKASVFCIVMGNFSNCMLGYKLDSAHQGKGYMHEALQAVVDNMFTVVGIHRIEINMIPRNTKSIKVAERLGFVREAKSREFIRINGVWEDHYRYVRLNPAK